MNEYPDYEVDETPSCVYTRGGALHVPEDACVPTELCVRCGRPSVKVIDQSIRKPLNPLTWYSRQTSVEIGLCRKHAEDRKVEVALAFSLLALGGVFLVGGLITLSTGMIIFGLLAIISSGYFRARFPVYRSKPEGWVLQIEGAGDGFLKQLPAFQGSDGV